MLIKVPVTELEPPARQCSEGHCLVYWDHAEYRDVPVTVSSDVITVAERYEISDLNPGLQGMVTVATGMTRMTEKTDSPAIGRPVNSRHILRGLHGLYLKMAQRVQYNLLISSKNLSLETKKLKYSYQVEVFTVSFTHSVARSRGLLLPPDLDTVGFLSYIIFTSLPFTPILEQHETISAHTIS